MNLGDVSRKAVAVLKLSCETAIGSGPADMNSMSDLTASTDRLEADELAIRFRETHLCSLESVYRFYETTTYRIPLKLEGLLLNHANKISTRGPLNP